MASETPLSEPFNFEPNDHQAATPQESDRYVPGSPISESFDRDNSDASREGMVRIDRSGSKRFRIIAICGMGLSALLLMSLILVAIQKERIRIVNHTITETQYVTVTPPLKWQIGACLRSINGGGGTQLTPCSGTYDWVIVGETTVKTSCLAYTQNGGWSSQSEWVENPNGSDFYCLVP